MPFPTFDGPGKAASDAGPLQACESVRVISAIVDARPTKTLQARKVPSAFCMRTTEQRCTPSEDIV